jgi:hypothetical protein
MIHELKTWPEHYAAVTHPDVTQRKTVELRKDDRGFKVGDDLLLREFDPTTGEYTGRQAERVVTHILTGGPWLAEGYVALSIREREWRLAN